MSLDIDAVAQGLAAAITSAGLQLNGKTVTAKSFMPDAVTEPLFAVVEFLVSPHKTFGGQAETTVTCRLFVARSDDQAGQQKCRIGLSTGDGTVLAALEAARGAPGESALDGAADDLVVQSIRGPRLYEVGSDFYYGIEYSIFVMG